MAKTLTSLTKRRSQLAEVRPSLTAEQAYLAALRKAIKAMAKSVEYWTLAAYRAAIDANQDAETVPDPEVVRAEDAKSAGMERRRLFGRLNDLRKRWERYFDDLAKRIATDAVEAAYAANKTAWQQRAKQEGFDIPMVLTDAQRTIMDVKVRDNVELITSIPEQYFKRIIGDVSRGFLAGRDVEHIAGKLHEAGHVTRTRAALIARDQSNKLTAQMNSARQRELGIRYAYWKHSSVDKDPRPNHLRASREKWVYDTQVGIDFGDQFGYVQPGEAINCRCGSRSIIPAIDEEITPDMLEPVSGFPGAYKLKSRTTK